MHMEGFGLIEKTPGNEQGFFVGCRRKRLAAHMEAYACCVQSGLLRRLQQRQGFLHGCAEFRIEVHECFLVVDLNAHEYVGTGNEFCKFRDLTGIVEGEAADAEARGCLKPAAVAHGVCVNHAIARDAGGFEYLHLAVRGHIEVRAESGQTLQDAVVRIGLDGVTGLGPRQMPGEEAVILLDLVEREHHEWCRLLFGQFVHFVFVEDKASHNTTLPVDES